MTRNPNWSRDELILAFELYMARRDSLPPHDGPEIVALSELLNRVGQALGQRDSETYRNTNGVYMKLMNFRRFDPHFLANDGAAGGLKRGNKEEESIWVEFSADTGRLSRVATAIKLAVESLAASNDPGQFDDELVEIDAEEGRLLTRMHHVRERNRGIVQRKKTEVMDLLGRLQCEVCGFDFEDAFGPRGRGFIECHHTKPLHTLFEGSRTRLEDLALLCSNCHRIIHAAKPWISVKELIRIRRPNCDLVKPKGEGHP